MVFVIVVVVVVVVVVVAVVVVVVAHHAPSVIWQHLVREVKVAFSFCLSVFVLFNIIFVYDTT